jgi:hypothetical protein
MPELLKAVASWQSLLLVVLVFGFAPGFCLRLIVLAYPRGDPRRAELIAEMRAVPRIQRPLWVAEQLEVALFEGLPHRAVIRATQRRTLVFGSIAATAVVLVIAFSGAGVAANPVAGPFGASVECSDGVYSFSPHFAGTCSAHGGVAMWLAR